ncbi:unnamed protein product, partial [Allacma fusca]
MGKIGKKQLEKEMMEYFNAITEKPVLFVEIVALDKPQIHLNVENMIVLFLLDVYELYPLFTIKGLLVPRSCTNECVDSENKVSNTAMVYESEVFFQEVTAIINYSETKESRVSNGEAVDGANNMEISGCKKPSVHLVEKNMHIAGLSAVLRFLLKFACRRHGMCENESMASTKVKNVEILDQLLGYQRGCLQACAESSIWTKFCEVDMIQTVHVLETQLLRLVSTPAPSACLVDGGIPLSPSLRPVGLFELPKDLLRLEYHLTRPVRIHNFRKRIQKNDGGRQHAGGNNQSRNHQAHHDEPGKIRMNGQVQEQEEQPHPGQISHDFAEGPDFTLADLLLFPCVDIAVHALGQEMFKKYLPTVLGWHERVRGLLPSLPSATFEKGLSSEKDDIEGALTFLSSRGIQAFNFNEDKIPPFDWDSLPHLVHPEGGQLPVSRVEKKSQQLSNLALMVLKVFHDNYEAKFSSTGKKVTIVDFCSGGGHLGILLAYILPQCEVVLVENKEESLRRAENRVKVLGLPNISFFQCNLDYFTGHFEIGVALHACGTATDLVLAKCVQMRASFVCCPCCYGAIQSNHMLHYPRSSSFLSAVNTSGGLFSLKHYFVLGHAADQTHDEANEKTQQGKFSPDYLLRCIKDYYTNGCWMNQVSLFELACDDERGEEENLHPLKRKINTACVQGEQII